MPIPIIDLFAGPGGLGEGFSALHDEENRKVFKISLSIEKDPNAHKTLSLRSFFRQFNHGEIPQDYYDYIKGNITIEELYKRWPKEYKEAQREAWCVTLGNDKDAVSNAEVDERIYEALEEQKEWLLIGGPPCQAYSVVGRSRRKEKILDGKKDERVELYKQYLRILAVHNPTVFVMENVKGLLSAKTKENSVFKRILNDLKDPVTAYLSETKDTRQDLICPGYKIYSLIAEPKEFDDNGDPVYNQKDFVIKAEKYGIPQTRHRVILLGIRRNIDFSPKILVPHSPVPISKVLSGLPRLRSGLSKKDNGPETWKSVINEIKQRGVLTGINRNLKEEINNFLSRLSAPPHDRGKNFIKHENVNVNYKPDWFIDKNIGGVCNHESRGHMESDLHRYMFVSCFAKVKGVSPKLEDFPAALLPDHQNVDEGIEEKKFADRFRVQLWNSPAKTITSHISKDGHYYIHPDPTQCRSFTVREAARIQTFPDNYYFCGPRTSQFTQVGNAVPPLLANQIASKVVLIFKQNKVLIPQKSKVLLQTA